MTIIVITKKTPSNNVRSHGGFLIKESPHKGTSFWLNALEQLVKTSSQIRGYRLNRDLALR